jgi:competence protein ComEA
VHQPPEVLTAWPRSAQWALVVLLFLAAGLLLGQILTSLRWGSRPTERERGLAYRIDLNRANRAELLQLPGVGPKKVEEILAYRRAYGGFRSVEELGNVNGIGPATLDQLRPWVCVEAEDEDEARDLEDGPAKGKPKGRKRPVVKKVFNKSRKIAGKKGAILKEKININTATAEQLRRLPGIGETRAERIVAERQKRPFQSVDDLMRVRGIKEKIIDGLRPFATVGDRKGR